MIEGAPEGSDSGFRGTRTRVSRRRLLEMLPADGPSGHTTYAPPAAKPLFTSGWLAAEAAHHLAEVASASTTGSVLFEPPGQVMLVLPAFPVEKPASDAAIVTTQLRELMTRQRAFAVLLLRRGGYTVGFFRGDYLVQSKTDRRFVKNRHRKGGQSQRRFDRIRDKQILELLRKACADARATLEPYSDEVQHLFFGGDRLAINALRADCDYFERTYGERIHPRFLPVTGDPRRSSLDAVPRGVWSSDVWVLAQM
jgi:hypothetical protein